MRPTVNFISGIANAKIILASLILFATAMILVNSVFPSGVQNLTQTFGYTPEKAYEMLQQYGETGRLHHTRVLFADIVLVVLYSILFSTTIYFTIYRLLPAHPSLLNLSLLPYILAVIQLMEVLGIFILLKSYPTQMFLLARLTNIMTMSKFILTYFCILIPTGGFLALFVKWLIAFVRK